MKKQGPLPSWLIRQFAEYSGDYKYEIFLFFSLYLHFIDRSNKDFYKGYEELFRALLFDSTTPKQQTREFRAFPYFTR